MSAPCVLAIGTCRITRPLRLLHRSGAVHLLNKDSHWWFTHSSREAVQYARALAGEIDIPHDLRPLVCETTLDLPEDLAAPQFLRPDVTVVEVSTLRTLEVRGVRLNYHRAWKHASELGVPVTELDGVHPGMTSREDLLRDFDTIRQLTGAPLLLVDHVWARTADGAPIQSRVQLSELLASLGLPFHSTRAAIEEHGHDLALQDSTHYRSAFNAVAGASMLPSIIDAAEHRIAAVSTQTSPQSR